MNPGCREAVISGSGSSRSHSLITLVMLLMSDVHSLASRSTESRSAVSQRRGKQDAGSLPLSRRCLRLATLLVVPLMRYIPWDSRPYFSMASQHFLSMGGTSTSSRFICSFRSTPNVGRPLSTDELPFRLMIWVLVLAGGSGVCLSREYDGRGGKNPSSEGPSLRGPFGVALPRA